MNYEQKKNLNNNIALGPYFFTFHLVGTIDM